MPEDSIEDEDEIERIVRTGKSVDLEPQGKVTYKDKAAELKKTQQISDNTIIDVQQEIDKIIKEEHDLSFRNQAKSTISLEPAEQAQFGVDARSGPTKPVLTAQDILTKSKSELKQIAESDRRESHNLIRDMKIITAILLGKKQNKELSKVLDTDKSFTSKQITGLEERGLIKKETTGREVNYSVDQFNVMKFLQTRVVIKWKSDKKTEEKDGPNP
jgi:uncharacterized membrane protein